MKLNVFSAKTLPKQRLSTAAPRVSFNKAGTITFNQAACDLMKLSGGDKVSIAQDEEDPENWYFFKDDNGFEVRLGTDKKGCLFNHATMIKTVYESFGLTLETRGFLIAGQPTAINKKEYWCLLISNN